MRTIANIIWHIPFCGFLSALYTFLIGLLLLVTVIGAPIGLGLIQYSKFLLFPFSGKMVTKEEAGIKQNSAWQAYSFIIMIFYLPLGIILGIITIVQIVCLCITIVGIPLAIVLFKSLGTIINPVNKVCV